MENKLQQAKDAVAKKYGYESFEQFDDKSTFGYNHDTPKIINEVAIEYNRLCNEELRFIKKDDEIIAIDVCLMDDDKVEALVIGKSYKIESIINGCISIKSEWSNYHGFEIATLNEFFRPQPPTK